MTRVISHLASQRLLGRHLAHEVARHGIVGHFAESVPDLACNPVPQARFDEVTSTLVSLRSTRMGAHDQRLLGRLREMNFKLDHQNDASTEGGS